MKRILLFTLFLGGSVLFCSAQSNSNQPNVISTDGMKSKKTPAANEDQPVVNPADQTTPQTTPQNNVEVSGSRYLEYKVDQGNNSSSYTPADEEKVSFPIQAEGYTDPNYELNKQRSAEQTQQLEAPSVAEKTTEEMILDLQEKIKAIKDGTITGCTATTKLAAYEEELKSLLNKK
jgi:hypothetical protein